MEGISPGNPQEFFGIAKKTPESPKPNGNERFNSLWNRERELVNQVAEQGVSLLNTWTHESGAQVSAGWQFINPADRGIYSRDQGADEYWTTDALQLINKGFRDPQTYENPLRDNGVYEAVVLTPVTREVKGTKPVTKVVQQRGFLSRVRQVEQTVEKQAVVGQEPLTVREVLGADSDEQAVGIYYMAQDYDDPLIPLQQHYRDAHGRPGNSLSFRVIVPASLAQQVSQTMKEDPGLIRRIVDTVVSRKYPKNFIQQVWKTYGFPPYENWEKYRKPALYLEDTTEHPEDQDQLGNLPYNPDRVIRFHTEVIAGKPFAIPENTPSQQ